VYGMGQYAVARSIRKKSLGFPRRRLAIDRDPPRFSSPFGACRQSYGRKSENWGNVLLPTARSTLALPTNNGYSCRAGGEELQLEMAISRVSVRHLATVSGTILRGSPIPSGLAERIASRM